VYREICITVEKIKERMTFVVSADTWMKARPDTGVKTPGSRHRAVAPAITGDRDA
jgi:hypothetical protein